MPSMMAFTDVLIRKIQGLKMDKLAGVWVLESSKNFDAYMKAIDMTLLMRVAGGAAKPELIIEICGKSVTMRSKSSFKNALMSTAKLGQEVEETTLDGRKTMSTYKLEGDKLVQIQRWKNKESRIVRYVKNDLLYIDLYVDDVQARRVYRRKK